MRAIVILGVLAVAGCRSGTIVEPLGYAVILYGRVQAIGGVPIAGATLTIKNHHGTCGSGGVENETATTDVNGRYRKSFTVTGGGEGCVRIAATAVGFAPDSATLTNVPFVEPPSIDSVETNILLRAQ